MARGRPITRPAMLSEEEDDDEVVVAQKRLKTATASTSAPTSSFFAPAPTALRAAGPTAQPSRDGNFSRHARPNRSLKAGQAGSARRSLVPAPSTPSKRKTTARVAPPPPTKKARIDPAIQTKKRRYAKSAAARPVTPPVEDSSDEDQKEGDSTDDDDNVIEQVLLHPSASLSSKPTPSSRPHSFNPLPTPDPSPTKPPPVATVASDSDPGPESDSEPEQDSGSEDELRILPMATPEKRVSDRNRGLPAPVPASVPRELTTILVGCEDSLEDEMVSPDPEPEVDDGPDLEIEVDAEVDQRTRYAPAVVRRVLESAGKSKSNTQLLEGYAKWESAVRYAMQGVVKQKVGNCVIVLGQRGVGKTLMIERSLVSIEKEFGVDSFIPVRLNGLVHTTDRQALRSIARQLKMQGFVDDDGDWGSSAATMATLLAMLEPPLGTVGADKPILLVLDEFDLLALHPRQSFLYCLLDIVQGNRRKAGMGVIGVSARTDCMSLLEKRVRSRCQSQVLQLVLENSWDAYLARASSLLRITTSQEDETVRSAVEDWNDEVEAFLADPITVRYLERLWKLHGNSPTHLVQAFTVMRAKLEWVTRHTKAAWSSPPPESLPMPRLSVGLLPRFEKAGLRDDLLRRCVHSFLSCHWKCLTSIVPHSERTVLELTVCVAAKHARRDHGAVNLEMLYDCYFSHHRRIAAGESVSLRPFTKSAFGRALDVLRELELFLPAAGRPSASFIPSVADSFKMLKFVPWAGALDDVVKGRPDVPSRTKVWCENWAQ